MPKRCWSTQTNSQERVLLSFHKRSRRAQSCSIVMSWSVWKYNQYWKDSISAQWAKWRGCLLLVGVFWERAFLGSREFCWVLFGRGSTKMKWRHWIENEISWGNTDVMNHEKRTKQRNARCVSQNFSRVFLPAVATWKWFRRFRWWLTFPRNNIGQRDLLWV